MVINMYLFLIMKFFQLFNLSSQHCDTLFKTQFMKNSLDILENRINQSDNNNYFLPIYKNLKRIYDDLGFLELNTVPLDKTIVEDFQLEITNKIDTLSRNTRANERNVVNQIDTLSKNNRANGNDVLNKKDRSLECLQTNEKHPNDNILYHTDEFSETNNENKNFYLKEKGSQIDEFSSFRNSFHNYLKYILLCCFTDSQYVDTFEFFRSLYIICYITTIDKLENFHLKYSSIQLENKQTSHPIKSNVNDTETKECSQRVLKNELCMCLGICNGKCLSFELQTWLKYFDYCEEIKVKPLYDESQSRIKNYLDFLLINSLECLNAATNLICSMIDNLTGKSKISINNTTHN